MNSITVVGNLVSDVELKTLEPSNATVAEFRVAVNESYRDKGGDLKDGKTTYIDVSVWGKSADNASQSLEKGDRVIVCGRLEGESKFYRIKAEAVGLSLQYTTAKAMTGVSE